MCPQSTPRRVEFSCAYCGKVVNKFRSQAGKYCSRNCAGLAKRDPNGASKTFAKLNDPRYREWRKTCLVRDDYTCQKCGRVFIPGQRGLHVHHLKPYAKFPEVRYDPDNGTALCARCHRAHHTIVHVEDYEQIEKVACACGCGEMIYPINLSGQAVRYKQYHGRRGKTFTAESRARTSAALTGRKRGPFTAEHIQHMKEARRKRQPSDKPSPLKGWRNTYMTQDEFIAVYPTMTSRQIAATCHVSEASVCLWAKKLGLPSRYKKVV